MRAARAPSKYGKSDTLYTKIAVAVVGTSFVRPVGRVSPSVFFICGQRAGLRPPRRYGRTSCRFPQFTSDGLYRKIWRRKKTITEEEKRDHS